MSDIDDVLAAGATNETLTDTERADIEALVDAAAAVVDGKTTIAGQRAALIARALERADTRTAAGLADHVVDGVPDIVAVKDLALEENLGHTVRALPNRTTCALWNAGEGRWRMQTGGVQILDGILSEQVVQPRYREAVALAEQAREAARLMPDDKPAAAQAKSREARAQTWATFAGGPKLGHVRNQWLHEAHGIVTDFDDFDPKNTWNYLNTPTCMLDLDAPRATMRLRHHPDHLVTRTTGTTPAPLAGSLWEQVLDRLFDEEMRDHLQLLLGACISGDVNKKKLIFLVGGGNTGKTSFMRCVEAALGDYLQRGETAMLYRNVGNEKHRTFEYDLRNAHIAWFDEAEANRRLDAAHIKDLTGGGVRKVNRMREDPIEYQAKYAIVVTTNEVPKMDGTDSGLEKRLHVINFERTLTPGQDGGDPTQTITNTPHERGAVLSWLLTGWLRYRDLRAQGKDITPPARSTLGRQLVLELSDPLLQWMSDELVTTGSPDIQVPGAALYHAYRDWYDENIGPRNGTPLPAITFHKKLIDAGGGLITKSPRYPGSHNNRHVTLAGCSLRRTAQQHAEEQPPPDLTEPPPEEDR